MSWPEDDCQCPICRLRKAFADRTDGKSQESLLATIPNISKQELIRLKEANRHTVIGSVLLIEYDERSCLVIRPSRMLLIFKSYDVMLGISTMMEDVMDALIPSKQRPS